MTRYCATPRTLRKSTPWLGSLGDSPRLKRELDNQCILPVTTYGAETHVFMKTIYKKLKINQRGIKRNNLLITLKDCKTNVWLREKTGVQDFTDRDSSSIKEEFDVATGVEK